MIWDFLDAIIGRHTGTALQILSSVLSQGEEPERVLAILGRTLPRLILSKVLSSGATPPAEAASALRSPAWQVSRLFKQASEFEMRDLRRMLSALVDLDFDYKSGRLPYRGLDGRIGGAYGAILLSAVRRTGGGRPSLGGLFPGATGLRTGLRSGLRSRFRADSGI